MPTFSKAGKWRRRLRWASWTALSLLILIGVGAGLLWYDQERTAAEGKKLLADAIAETDELDPRWRWEQIQEDLPPIPDSENSMRVITQVADSLQGNDPLPLIFPDGEHVLDDYPSNRQLDQERLKLVQDILNKQQQSLELAITLTDFRRGRGVLDLKPDYISTLLKHVQDCRPAFTLLELDAERLLNQGRPHDAALRIRTIFYAAAALRDEPFVISQLVRLAGRGVAISQAERLLGKAEPGDDDIKGLMEHIRAELGERLMLTGVRGERAGYNFLFENLESGRLTLADFFADAADHSKTNPDLSLRIGASIYQARLYEDHAFMLVTMNHGCKIAQLPWQEQSGAWSEWKQNLDITRANHLGDKKLILSGLLMPAIDRVGMAAIRDQARLSCLHTALAAERFRLAHKRWPKDLKELVPGYLAQVPIDPFDGQPLKFAQREDGIVIYSVDKDGQDNGGDIHKQSPEDDNPKDLGVRLWNPDHRRLPPLPKKKEQPNDDDDGGS